MASARSRERPVTLSALDPDSLRVLLDSWGEPPFRARQILSWIHERFVLDPARMTDLPARLRERLAAEIPGSSSAVETWHESPDGTEKAILRLADGERVECVLIPDEERGRGPLARPLLRKGSGCDEAGEGVFPLPLTRRWTLCVSTQVGCAVRCAFCASGLGGLVRNLAACEIVEQFLHACARLATRGATLSNVVVMGMGEPLHNVEALLAALGALGADWGPRFGARRVTVSTSGVVRGIQRLAQEGEPWNLALSLHAPNDEIRSRIVPHRGLGSVAEVIEAGRAYQATKNRRVSIEYVLLAGVNDRPEHARELARRIRGTGFHVNLIPYNPVAGLAYERPGDETVERFAAEVRGSAAVVTTRRRRGDEISAACGQLRLLRAEP